MDKIDIGLEKPVMFTKEKHQLLDRVYIYESSKTGDLIEANSEE